MKRMKKIEKVPATPYVRDPVTGRSVYDPYAAHLIDRYNQAKGRGPQGEKPFLKPKVGDVINISSRLSLPQYPVWVDQVSDDKWSGFHVEKKANGDWHFFSAPVQTNRVGGFNGDDVRKIVTHLSGKPKPEIPWSPKNLVSNRSKSESKAKTAKAIVARKTMKRNPLLDLRSGDALAKDIPNAAKYKAALDTVKPYVSEFSKIFSRINRLEPNTPKSIAAVEAVIPRVKKFLQILTSLQRTFKFLRDVDTSGMQEFINTKNSRKFVIWPNSVYKKLLEHSKAHYGKL